MIELKNIKKTYEADNLSVEALKGISLNIGKADIFGIIGYSGSGKSTLIRCINLLEKPDSGQVIFNGKDLNKLSERDLRRERQKIGMIFQHFNLLSYDTVYANVALPLVYKGLNKKEIEEKVDNLLEIVGLSDKKNAYPSQLSGGQKQRVSIARALANDPEVLLSDEATSALDPQTTDSILNLLKDLNKKFGLTIVIITHEMQVIKEICNKVAVLSDGRIVEQGTALEVFSKPKHEITKEFVASIFQSDKIYELLNNESISKIVKNKGIVVRLLFTGSSANDAYISTISREFQINLSVIFGNIEIIQDEPVGCLFIAFSGEAYKIKKAINYLEEEKVQIDFIRGEENLLEVEVV
ncbi:Phosphonate-transporting ATPase [Clostridium sp. DL-VIII]|uniref:methionine ABC transporter ATP-binding protein n=1 Tax=Clostridium sp. DL-VIII TaxID=641107 RepID=UPI00023B03A4|nr:methionine ABC transporter ATP-binding protein [Clostridium sp. DL-VIII]EHJ01834.1 Phosphonate-transporting ATPase [Clostridium sp. DL-VIII]